VSCHVLCVSALHPEDGLRDARLDGRGQTALAGRDAGKTCGVESDVCKGRDDDGRDPGGRLLPPEVELSAALANVGREERGTVAARDAAIDKPVAERALQSAQQLDSEGLLGLGKEVVALVLRRPHPCLMASLESVVLSKSHEAPTSKIESKSRQPPTRKS
jgi:hypothetical protein